MAKQVKSKSRVANFGEVFTAEREVNAMLDLVKDETLRIESRFLEPACGDGNFLAEILKRKLAVVKKKYKKYPADFEKYSLLAVSSIYGVDILQDNTLLCQERLFKIWGKEYKKVCKNEVDENVKKSISFILKRNIVCGNALSMMCVDENQQDTKNPIVFSEWAFITGNQLQRSDYSFEKLLNANQEQANIIPQEQNTENSSLFDSENIVDEEGEFLKKYIADYRRIWENE